nr:Von Willebrand factor type A domain protein [uncultured bacterium]
MDYSAALLRRSLLPSLVVAGLIVATFTILAALRDASADEPTESEAESPSAEVPGLEDSLAGHLFTVEEAPPGPGEPEGEGMHVSLTTEEQAVVNQFLKKNRVPAWAEVEARAWAEEHVSDIIAAQQPQTLADLVTAAREEAESIVAESGPGFGGGAVFLSGQSGAKASSPAKPAVPHRFIQRNRTIPAQEVFRNEALGIGAAFSSDTVQVLELQLPLAFRSYPAGQTDCDDPEVAEGYFAFRFFEGDPMPMEVALHIEHETEDNLQHVFLSSPFSPERRVLDDIDSPFDHTFTENELDSFSLLVDIGLANGEVYEGEEEYTDENVYGIAGIIGLSTGTFCEISLSELGVSGGPEQSIFFYYNPATMDVFWGGHGLAIGEEAPAAFELRGHGGTPSVVVENPDPEDFLYPLSRGELAKIWGPGGLESVALLYDDVGGSPLTLEGIPDCPQNIGFVMSCAFELDPDWLTSPAEGVVPGNFMFAMWPHGGSTYVHLDLSQTDGPTWVQDFAEENEDPLVEWQVIGEEFDHFWDMCSMPTGSLGAYLHVTTETIPEGAYGGQIACTDIEEFFEPAIYKTSCPVSWTLRLEDPGVDLSAFGLYVRLPYGWSFLSAEAGDGEGEGEPDPSVLPTNGDTGRLDFGWIVPPPFPYDLTLHLLPAGEPESSPLGARRISYQMLYRKALPEGEPEGEGEAEPEGEGEGEIDPNSSFYSPIHRVRFVTHLPEILPPGEGEGEEEGEGEGEDCPVDEFANEPGNTTSENFEGTFQLPITATEDECPPEDALLVYACEIDFTGAEGSATGAFEVYQNEETTSFLFTITHDSLDALVLEMRDGSTMPGGDVIVSLGAAAQSAEICRSFTNTEMEALSYYETIYFALTDTEDIEQFDGTPTACEGEGEGESQGFPIFGMVYLCPAPHSADIDGDFRVSLSELLRLIQFLSEGGGIHCDQQTEDGYELGLGGDHSCIPHDSDYDPQDWTIDLSELLRGIQFYNCKVYQRRDGTEDGFGFPDPLPQKINLDSREYRAGSLLRIHLTLDGSTISAVPIDAVGITISVPEGWRFYCSPDVEGEPQSPLYGMCYEGEGAVSIGDAEQDTFPDFVPSVNKTGQLDFTYAEVPEALSAPETLDLVVMVAVPEGACGTQYIGAQITVLSSDIYSNSAPEYFQVSFGGPGPSEASIELPVSFTGAQVFTPVDQQDGTEWPEGGCPIVRFHTADTDFNWQISDAELSRVHDLMDLTGDVSGDYGCAVDPVFTEDGFVPGGTDISCGVYHNADYDEDWSISQLEYDRVAQLYRAGHYHTDDGSFDGFAAGDSICNGIRSLEYYNPISEGEPHYFGTAVGGSTSDHPDGEIKYKTWFYNTFVVHDTNENDTEGDGHFGPYNSTRTLDPTGTWFGDAYCQDEKYCRNDAAECNSMTTSNGSTWEMMRPNWKALPDPEDKGALALESTDATVQYANEHGQKVMLQHLLWHQHLPVGFKTLSQVNRRTEIALHMEEIAAWQAEHWDDVVRAMDPLNEYVTDGNWSSDEELLPEPFDSIIEGEPLTSSFDPDDDAREGDLGYADDPEFGFETVKRAFWYARLYMPDTYLFYNDYFVDSIYSVEENKVTPTYDYVEAPATSHGIMYSKKPRGCMSS